MSEISLNLSLILLLTLEVIALVLALGLYFLKRSSISDARWAWWAWSGLGTIALIGLILIVKEIEYACRCFREKAMDTNDRENPCFGNARQKSLHSFRQI